MRGKKFFLILGILIFFNLVLVSADFGYNVVETPQSITININEEGAGGGGNISATEAPYLYDDGTTVSFNETVLNATIVALASGSENASWNEALALTLFAGIEWDYNQSLATFEMWNSTWDQSGVAAGSGNTSWNESYARELFPDISFNFTSETFDNFNATWDQSWVEEFAYNHTSEVFDVWNATWDQSWIDNIIGNCSADEVVFGINATGGKVCVSDATGEGGKGTDGEYMYNTSVNILFNDTLLNDTIDDKINGITNFTADTFDAYNSTWDQSWTEEFAYNHTSEVFDVWNATWDQSGVVSGDFSFTDFQASFDLNETNHSADTFDLNNATWDQSWGEEFMYNHTADTFTNYNTTWDQSYMTSFPGYDSEIAFENETNTFAADQNFSEDITLLTDKFICLDAGCTKWIKSNSTGVFIQG